MYEKLALEDVIQFSGIRTALEQGTPFVLKQISGGLEFTAKNDLDLRSRKILLAGGLAAYTRQGGQ
jgi:aconitate hydratase